MGNTKPYMHRILAIFLLPQCSDQSAAAIQSYSWRDALSLEVRSYHVINEKKPGWSRYEGDFTTQLYRDYNKP